MSDSNRPKPRANRKRFRPENEKSLRELRSTLVEHHKFLMEIARREWERAHGRTAGPGELLHLLMEDPDLAWLRLLSSKIARLDAILDDPEEGAAETLVAELDRLILERGPEEAEFQLRYESALAGSADVSLLHVQVVHAMRSVRGVALSLLDPS
jgi:hypothetical protein